MKIKYLSWIMVLCLFFSGCGKQGTEANVQNTQGTYVAQACGVPGLQGTINSTLMVGSKLYAGVYTKGTAVADGRYSVVIYDVSDGTTERTILKGREEMAMWSFTVLEDGNYKALFLVWSSEEQDYTSLCLGTFDREGNLMEERDILQNVAEQVPDVVPMNNFCMDRSGTLFFYNSTYSGISVTSKIYSVQKNGEVQFIKECSDSMFGLQTVSSHLWFARDPDPKKIIIEEIGDPGKESKKIATLGLNVKSPSIDMSAGYTEEQVFLTLDASVYEYDLASKQLVKLFDHEDVGLVPGTFSTGKLIATAQDEFYVLSKTAETEDGLRTYDWLRITRSNEASQKEVLTIAVSEESSLLKEAVTAFNKSSEQYKVVVKVYEKEGGNVPSALLQAEIAAGNAPDVVAVDAIDFDAMVNMGMLHDLSDFLEGDPELSKDGFVGRSLEIYERNDKVYAIPRSLLLTAMTGKKKLLEGRESWDFQEFEEYVHSFSKEGEVSLGLSKSQLLQYILEQHVSSFVDWENRTCSFESDDFKELLKFVQTYSNGESPGEASDLERYVDMLHSDEIILYLSAISEPYDYQFSRILWGEDVAYIGFPSASGTGIRLADASEATDAYAILETSAHKAEMWEILKYVLTNPRLAESGLPAYQPLFDKACENAMEKNLVQSGDDVMVEEPKLEVELSGMKFTIYAATEEEISLIRGLLERAEPVKTSSPVIMNVIQEEVQGYFDGQKSVDEVVRIIQNKVSVYLSQ